MDDTRRPAGPRIPGQARPQREVPGEPSTALKALVRIGATMGLALDPAQLRRASPFDGDEPPPDLLVKICERAGFRTKRIRVRRGELATLERLTPAILLLKNGKSVLLSKIQLGTGAPLALLEDVGREPAVTALLEEARLANAWDGEVLLVQRRWRLTDRDRPFDLKWLAGQVLRERRLFRDVAIASFFMSLLALVPPFVFMTMIDRVMFYRSEATLQVLGVALVFLVAFEAAFGFLRRKLTAVAVARVDARINLAVFDRLLNLPLSFFEKSSTGVISGKIGQIWFIRQFLVEVLCGTVLDAVMLMVLVPVLLLLNWKLTILVLVLAVGMLVIYTLFLPALRLRHGAVIRAEQRMGQHQVETIFGIKTVKSLALDGLKRRQRDERVAAVTEARRSLDFLANAPQTMAMPLERLIYSGSFFFGCYMAIQQTSAEATASVGSLMAFSMLAGRVAGPIVQFAGLINSYEYAQGAIGEVASVMNAPAEQGRSGAGLRLPIKGQVVFDEVRFRYSPEAKPALDGVSFDVPQGTILGVMGRSGSGKTTVTRLLQGLSRDYEGLIKIDGMDLREIDLDHLRANIGVVPQESFLFSGTIAENIGAARPNAGFGAIVRAAQLAGAEEFIERLPNGYATMVEEGAVNFSGGQRQRLAIARTLICDPPILLLDEATSALDAESEAIVNANLMRIAKGRTVFIISHRLSSLVACDKILVLERGKLYDAAPHRELVERCDIYRALWFQQNRHLVQEDPNVRH